MTLPAKNTVPDVTNGRWVAPGLEAVERVFRQIQDQSDELGGALCVYHKGRPIVDLWAGHTSPARTHLWQHDTVVSLFSAGKALTTLCLLHLVDRGSAGLDDPVVLHWPEFARADKVAKSEVTLRHLLHHSAGLPTAKTHRPGDVYNWDRMISGLEQAPLLWPAGSKTAYHAVTFGHLVGEVVRRLSNQMPSDYFARHFAGPLGLDLSVRLALEQKDRLATCDGYGWKTKLRCGVFSHVLPLMGGWHTQYFRPCGHDYHPSSQRWQAAEAPAISAFGSARGLARLYAMLSKGGSLDGVQVLSSSIVEQVANERPAPVHDLGVRQDVRLGLGLYFNLAPVADLGPNPNAFGHVGMGGVTSFADPDHEIGFAYVCNHLYQPTAKDNSIIGSRASDLADTLYKALL